MFIYKKHLVDPEVSAGITLRPGTTKEEFLACVEYCKKCTNETGIYFYARIAEEDDEEETE